MTDLFGYEPTPLPEEDGRVIADLYETPVDVVQDLLPLIDFQPGDTFFEPCKASGNIYNAVPVGTKEWAEIREGRDYLAEPLAVTVDFIITNPPFSLANIFLTKSLLEAKVVIYLLPLNYLGGVDRAAFWNHNIPTHLLPLKRRPVFIWVCEDCKSKFQPGAARFCPGCSGNVIAQTDMVNYAWFVWDSLGRLKLDQWLYVL